ncbi:MAG: hypothetical protein Q8L81_06960 [Bacteroidota bacterium]|nr:hypothetical protein [Bacteroidota bacterium]
MKILKNILSILNNHNILKKELEELKILTGKQLTSSLSNVDSLKKAEFKVFSQWGDDGIIQYIINKIQISNDFFVEFGVENYTEANTRFLLVNNNWSGLVMDGSGSNIEQIKKDSVYWQHELNAKHAFITAENINEILNTENVPDKIGLLHIDIDGNDYWIWKNINRVKADIVIVEYNSLFGPERAITIPYKKDFFRTTAHFSNLYYGCSISSLCDLAKEKGYSFVGCNSAGNNAYFILNEKLGNIKALTPAEGYVRSKFKESRDENGMLTFISGKPRENKIKDLEVFNTRTNQLERI